MSLSAIKLQMQQGLASSVFPGAVLLVSHQNKLVFHEAFGQRVMCPEQKPVKLQTFFDLASLTKPLVTATAIVQLLQQKLIHLQDPLQKFLPHFSGIEKKQVTLFHLLNHSSGLPAWQPYYQTILARDKKESGFLGSLAAKESIFKMAQSEALVTRPGETNCYSDIGFILLGEVVEKVCKMTLDTYFFKHIASALKTSESFFPRTPGNPQGMSKTNTSTFAATEDSMWRKGIISGVVHDDNTYVMGGVAGHAGLFASAFGVYQLVCAWLDAIEGEGFLSPEIATQFVSRQKKTQNPKTSSWALGWDTPSDRSSSGQHFSSSTFGHLGFTGTSIWVDRTHALLVILLTNRVHPSRENEAIRSFRPKLHDTIFETFIHG